MPNLELETQENIPHNIMRCANFYNDFSETVLTKMQEGLHVFEAMEEVFTQIKNNSIFLGMPGINTNFTHQIIDDKEIKIDFKYSFSNGKTLTESFQFTAQKAHLTSSSEDKTSSIVIENGLITDCTTEDLSISLRRVVAYMRNLKIKKKSFSLIEDELHKRKLDTQAAIPDNIQHCANFYNTFNEMVKEKMEAGQSHENATQEIFQKIKNKSTFLNWPDIDTKFTSYIQSDQIHIAFEYSFLDGKKYTESFQFDKDRVCLNKFSNEHITETIIIDKGIMKHCSSKDPALFLSQAVHYILPKITLTQEIKRVSLNQSQNPHRTFNTSRKPANLTSTEHGRTFETPGIHK